MTTWADRRKHLIEAILIACAVALVAVVVIASVYKAPSCNDGKQDEGEQGIDCGGPCPYACDFTETAPTVQFIRAISPQPGRTDVIAYIENPNSDVELVNAPYTIDLYGSNKTVVAQSNGVVTIPPSTTYPLYLPDFYHASAPISQSFLTFATSSYAWFRTTEKPIVPTPASIQIQSGATPKITASLGNPTAETLYGVTVIATVFNAANNAIAASQTYIPQIPPQGSAPIVFTWNEAFLGTAARVEILPVPTPASPASS